MYSSLCWCDVACYCCTAWLFNINVLKVVGSDALCIDTLCLGFSFSNRISLGHIWLDAKWSTSWNPGVSTVRGCGVARPAVQRPECHRHRLLSRRLWHREWLSSTAGGFPHQRWPSTAAATRVQRPLRHAEGPEQRPGPVCRLCAGLGGSSAAPIPAPALQSKPVPATTRVPKWPGRRRGSRCHFHLSQHHASFHHVHQWLQRGLPFRL